MLVQFKKDSEAGGDKIRGVLREVRWRGKCQTTYTRWARLEVLPWGTWVAQSVMHPTLGFGSGHDLTVVKSSPLASGSVLGVEPAYGCLSLSLCLSPARALSQK